MNLWKNTALRLFLLFVSLIFAYFVLLVAGYGLKSPAINNHAAIAVEEIASQRSVAFGGSSWNPTIFPGQYSTEIDLYSDELGLGLILGADSYSPLQSSMAANPRYWNGYMVFLRPFLAVFTYSEIKILQGLLVFAFLGVVLYKGGKRLGIGYVVSFGVSLAVGMLHFAMMSLHTGRMPAVLLFTNLLLLWLYKPVDTEALTVRLAIFLVSGSLTAFFDLLTIPMAVLGCLLVTLAYIDIRETGSSPKELLVQMISGGLIWGLSYGLTWASKWVVSSLVTGQNIWSAGLNSVFFRMAGEVEYSGEMATTSNAIFLNFKTFFSRPVMLVLFCCLLYIAVLLYRRRKNLHFRPVFLIVLLPGLLPVVWYSLVVNHSQVHFWFTFRALIATVFAALSFFALFVQSRWTISR